MMPTFALDWPDPHWARLKMLMRLHYLHLFNLFLIFLLGALLIDRTTELLLGCTIPLMAVWFVLEVKIQVAIASYPCPHCRHYFFSHRPWLGADYQSRRCLHCDYNPY